MGGKRIEILISIYTGISWIIVVLHNISMGGGNDKENQLKKVDGWIMVITKPKGPRNIS